MKLYESITKNLKESENIQYSEEDNKKLEEIYNNLQAGISYGIDRDKEHFSWITYPYFDAVLYLIANNGVGREVIGWRNYGSSANPNTLKDLKWILDTIFEQTPTEFLNTYIKSTDSKLMESENITLTEAAGSLNFAQALLDLFNETYDGMGDMYAADEWAEVLADSYDIDTDGKEVNDIILEALNKMDDSAKKDEADNFIYGLYENDYLEYLKNTLHIYSRNREHIIDCLNTIKQYASEPEKVEQAISELQNVNIDLRTTAEEFQRYLHDNAKPWTVLGTTTGPRTYVASELFDIPTEYDIIGADRFNYSGVPSDVLDNIGYGWKQTDNGIRADLIGFGHSISGNSAVYDKELVLYGYTAIITPENKDEKFKEMANALIKKASELKKQFGLKEAELKEMENSEGLTNIQFAEYCKDKLADLGTVKVKNFDDEDVDVKVAFEQPIRDYGTCKILDNEDTINKLGSDGETLEFVDEKGEYHNSPMISPITLVSRCEFDKIDNNFYKSIIQYWSDIKDLFESDAYDTNEEARPTPAVDRSGEPYNDGSRIDPRTGERFFGKTVAEEYQAEVDKCLDAYNNKDLDTAYKAWCQLHEILDKRLDSAGPKDDDRFPLYKEWQTYIDKIPSDIMYEITDYGKNKIYAEEYGLKEADGSRLLGGRYRTMSELRDLFKEYADHFETKGNRIKGNTPEDSYNRGWELGKADAYKLAAFEIENNVDPSLLGEAEDSNMNTTSLYIDIDELAKYAELYLQEKLGYAKVFKEPGKQYTYMLAIRRDDDSAAKWIKLHDGLFNESEILNEGNYGSAFVAEVLYDGSVGTCRGFGHTAEEAKENAFKLFKQVYPDYIDTAVYKTMKNDLDKNEGRLPNEAEWEKVAERTYTDEEAFNAVNSWYGINVFDLSSGATNEAGNTLKESEEIETEEPAKQLWVYVSKHGLGPGTIPNDVEAQYVTSLPGTGKDIFSVSRELTPEELNKYELSLFDNKYFAKYPEVVKELFSLNND